jgi:hypothetical protein
VLLYGLWPCTLALPQHKSVDVTIVYLPVTLASAYACVRACAYAQAGHSATALFVLSSGVLLRYTVKGALHLENHDGGPGESRFMFGQVRSVYA